MAVGRLPHRDPNQPALVFVPGDFGDGDTAWGELIARIGPRARTLVVERPEIDDPGRHFSFAGDAATVIQAIESWTTGRVHLVGHSYGGLVAIAAAAARPDLLHSLHLIEPPLFALVPEDATAQAMNQEARRIQSRYDRSGGEASTEAFFTMIGAERAVERLRGTAEWEHLTRHAARFARSEPAGDFPLATLDRVPHDVRIAIYRGGRSHPALREIAAALAARLPGARLHEFPDANHAVQRAGEPFVARLLDEAAGAASRRSPAADAARE